jgi:GTPase SAR1 family protein
MGAKGAYIVRLLMVGDSSCGKTSLVLRFDQNVFSTKFVTTIGVDYRDKMVKVREERDGRRCMWSFLQEFTDLNFLLFVP